MGILNYISKITTVTNSKYKDKTANIFYELLFCDNLELFKQNTSEPLKYPYDSLFSEQSTINDLQKIIDDKTTDPRVKILAYKKQNTIGHKPIKKELIAVIVEIGLENGTDVLASFNDGTARYINQSGKMIVWEVLDDKVVNEITQNLFEQSLKIVNQIGVWDKPRRPQPDKGNARISFLVSNELYFGEGPIDHLFNDQMACPAIEHATHLLMYLTEKTK